MEGVTGVAMGPMGQGSLKMTAQCFKVCTSLSPSSSHAFLTTVLQRGHSSIHQAFTEPVLYAVCGLTLEEGPPAPRAMQIMRGVGTGRTMSRQTTINCNKG